MSHNPEKEKQVPETVTERLYDMREAVAYGRGVIERTGSLPTIEVVEPTTMPTVPTNTVHSAEVIDLDTERRLREARRDVEVA